MRRWVSILALAVVASPAAADLWYEHYTRAEKALRSEEWAVAVEELNEAIARKGDSGGRARTYGMKFIEYFPYLKLGIAYYELGQHQAAAQAFETEERLGAVTEAREAHAELLDYRGRIEAAREAREAEEARRIRGIVTRSLEEARRLEGLGQPEEAMEALGRAEAVLPDSPEVRSALERLRQRAAELRREEERSARLAQLVADGRTSLGQRRYSDAARAFRQALAEESNPEWQALLEKARRALAAELADQDNERRREIVGETLQNARELEARGLLEDALAELESAGLLDPGNEDVLELRRRWLEARQREEAESARRETIARLLEESETDFEAGRTEKALSKANQVLALEVGNSAALGLVSRSYQAISRALLGPGAKENIPPAIRFADFRSEQDDGRQVERVDLPDFRLAGIVIDDGAVDVSFYAGETEIRGQVRDQEVGEYHVTEFALEHRLRPGALELRLVAVDSEGLSASSVYAVEYDRPWYRAGAFYAAISALAAAGITAAAALQYRRRRRRYTRRFNPYVAGAPILDEKLFFGRQDLLERILQTLHNNSLLLYGERRIGKTSIQHQLKKRLLEIDDPQYDFYPVYVDLQGTAQEKFFSALSEEIFLELGERVGLRASEAEDYGYRELVGDLRRLLAALGERSSKHVKLVLLIDEVDELNEYDPKINQRLRSLFMKSFAEHLVAVVSGVAIKKEWRREASPWYNFFEEIEVRAFRPEEARELVERPIRGLFKLEAGVTDRILERTGAKPYLVQKLCMGLVRRLYEKNRRKITLADVEKVGRVVN